MKPSFPGGKGHFYLYILIQLRNTSYVMVVGINYSVELREDQNCLISTRYLSYKMNYMYSSSNALKLCTGTLSHIW